MRLKKVGQKYISPHPMIFIWWQELGRLCYGLKKINQHVFLFWSIQIFNVPSVKEFKVLCKKLEKNILTQFNLDIAIFPCLFMKKLKFLRKRLSAPETKVNSGNFRLGFIKI